MSNTQVISAIVHQIVKERNTIAKAVKAKSTLAVDAALSNLISGVNGFFDGRRFIVYGKFDSDDKFTSSSISAYKNNKQSFTNCSTTIIDLLVKLMNAQSWATGGYLLFAHYKINGDEYITISMINDVDGVSIDDKTLTVHLSKHLELGRLHQAVRIEINEWKDGNTEYLAFVRSNPSDNVAQYFFSTMGCSEYKDAASITSRVATSVTKYLDDIKVKGADRILLRSKAYDYLRTQRDKREDATVAGLSSALFRDGPIKSYVDFIKERRYKIPESFYVDKCIKKMRHFHGSGVNFNISFEEEALTSREIEYDKTRKTLVICKIPERLLKRLNERE